jgi:hypothetical protein
VSEASCIVVLGGDLTSPATGGALEGLSPAFVEEERLCSVPAAVEETVELLAGAAFVVVDESVRDVAAVLAALSALAPSLPAIGLVRERASEQARRLESSGLWLVDDVGLRPLADLVSAVSRRTRAATCSLDRSAVRGRAIVPVSRAVIHDLNNVLCVIGTFLDLMLEEAPEGDPRRRDLLELLSASEKAKTLGATLVGSARAAAPELQADAGATKKPD